MKVSKLLRRVKKLNKKYFNRVKYYDFFKKLPIIKNTVLLDSQQGNNLNGNIFYILKELLENPEFKRFKVLVVVRKHRIGEFQSLLDTYGLKKAELLEMESRAYYEWMAQAEYLITDTSFWPFYVKKEGQHILNTWHGTPLKHMGKRDTSGFLNLGNVQRNFLMSDYVLYPNKFTREHMTQDYMIENLAEGRQLMAGYPRNEVFYDNEKGRNKIRKYLSENRVIADRSARLYAYMPTWRGKVGNVSSDEQIERVTQHLYEADRLLHDDEIMLVNFHPFVASSIDLNQFVHIKPFPKEFETYDILNACDALITDYSSVFFDYAGAGRPVYLFAYDEEEYLENRGMYLSLNDLPFPVSHTATELVESLRNPVYPDLSEFRKEYASLDGKGSSRKILQKFLLGISSGLQEDEFSYNGKQNVLLYAGNLKRNGLTSSLKSLLSVLDTTKYNYFISYGGGNSDSKREFIAGLPENVSYIPLPGKANATIPQKIQQIFFRKNFIDSEEMKKVYDEISPVDLRRLYPGRRFDHVIHFTGYDYKRVQEFARYPANRTVFVHNNIGEEIRVRNALHDRTVEYAFNTYDHVAIVTEDLREPTLEYCHRPDAIRLVQNTIDYKAIKELGNHPIEFDETTKSTHSVDELKELIDSGKTYITIGRFSPEKGHSRLIKAFEKIWKNDSSVNLVIIGGHGPLYEETLAQREQSPARERIAIIQSMKNPQSVLRKSDFFVLSSFHEGLGLVLLEANIQGLPIMSTDIPGPHGFLSRYGGLLVDDSEEGLVDGMQQMLEGKVPVLDIDYDSYNKNAIQEFESLLIK
ncbi:CDP-glycerol glycerophosphotransferase family protein [Faecalibaculum rodentium]|uniref:Glycosyl transferase family 1 domain-containing protein n=1 Tax=Faecalibaculum rodentium TaxID=1702221 RepID=A0A1Q9YN84_9FIRM|nr:CDP-glycerol glycerophosphotransferase family protein [Faecalibaculum rodentium]OLU47144.1 hypothetical protein BO223_01315 [Faecalibaculum rodentium]